MEWVLLIFLCWLALVAHELGHFFAVRRCGLRVKEVSLFGIPGHNRPSLGIRCGGVMWSVHLSFPSACVIYRDSRRALGQSSLTDEVYIAAAGALMNVVFAFVLFACAEVSVAMELGLHVGALALFLSVAALLCCANVLFSLLLGFLSPFVWLGAIGYSVFGTNEAGEIVFDMCVRFHEQGGFANTLVLAGVFSLYMGMASLMPIPHSDGFHIMKTMVHAWRSRRRPFLRRVRPISLS